jgi:hypothetical protein
MTAPATPATPSTKSQRHTSDHKGFGGKISEMSFDRYKRYQYGKGRPKVRLYFDPSDQCIVTEHGEMVEGITEFTFDYTTGKNSSSNLRMNMEMKECPPGPSPQEVEATAQQLQRLVDSFDP